MASETRAGPRRRPIRRLALAFLSLAGLILGAYVFLLPPLAAHWLRQSLRAHGLADARFELRAATATRVGLDRVRLGDRLYAEAVEVGFSPLELARGELDAVRVTGGRFVLDLDERAPRARKGRGAGAMAIEALPFRRLAVRASTLVVEHAGERIRLPFAGRVTRVAPQRASLALRTRFCGNEARLVGRAALGRRPRARMALLGPGAAPATATGPAPTTGPRAAPAFRCRLRWSGRGLRVPAGGRWLRVGAAEIDGAVGLTRGGELAGTDLSLELRELRGLETPIRRLRLRAATENGGDLTLRASAAGAAWRLDEARASLPSDPRAWKRLTIDWRAIARPSAFTGPGIAVDAPATAALAGRAEIDLHHGASVDLAGLRLRFAAAGGRVGGLRSGRIRAEARASGEIGPAGLEIRVDPGSRLSVDSLGLPGSRGGLAGRAGPLGELRVEGEGARFRLPWGEAPWSATLDGIGISGSLEAAGARLSVPSFQGRVAGTIAATGNGRIRGELRRPAELRLESLRAAAGGAAVETGPIELRLRSPETRPLWRGMGGEGAALAGVLEAASPVPFELAGAEGELRSLALRAAVPIAARSGRAATGELRLELGPVAHPPSGLSAESLRARVPFGPPGGTPSGSLRLGPFAWGDSGLPAIEGSARVAGGELRAAAEWPLGEGGAIPFRAVADARAGTADLSIPATRLSLSGDPIARLARAAGLEVEGELRLVGSLAAGPSPAARAARLRVALSDGAIRARAGAFALTGLAARLRLDRSQPLRAQSIRWEGGRAGELRLGPGALRFALAGRSGVYVERVSVGLASGGRVTAHGWRLDPGDPVIDTELFVERLALDHWLSLVTVDRAGGEGRLFGRLPVRIAFRPRFEAAVGAGFLHASGPGRLWVRDTPAVERVLANHAELAGQRDYSDLVRRRIVESLRDFAYRRLEFHVVREGDETLLRVTTKGKGRQVPQELDLTVNFTNFNRFLDLALGVKLGMDRARDALLPEGEAP